MWTGNLFLERMSNAMRKTQKLLALLMALLLAVGTLGTAVRAEGLTETETYVLNYNGAYEGAKWQYFSPYIPAWRYDGKFDCNNTIAFTLYDTRNGTGFPVYCTDVAVGLDNDSDFRRINLEDSTYAGAAAGKLRSVYLKGFPHTSVGDLAAAAGVEGLTVGEAVTATQLAIWSAAHGDRMKTGDLVYDFDTQWSSGGVTEHFAECYAEIENGYASRENEALIEAHIQQVYRYLMDLSPTAPAGAVASRRSFLAWDAEVVRSEDGTYTMTATATVDVTLNEGDDLTLTAMLGGCSASAALENGAHEYTLTVENIPSGLAAGAITLTIDGVQSLGDVYLFDAPGGRGESQSLIGYTANPLPVHVQVNANDRVLNIYKTAEGVGLQNITFDIYHVCSVEEYVNGDVVLGTGVVELDSKRYFSAPTQEDIAKYIQGLPFATVTTDALGRASFNFGNENDGIYIVAERENSLTTGAIQPFFVAVPGGSDADATDVYEIDVEPKNTLIGEDIEIAKDINEIGREQDTHHVGQVHTWIIRTSIPAGMATGLRYEITDSLNYQLTYAGNVKVAVSEREAPAHEDLVPLIEDEDYRLTVTEGTELVNGAEEPVTAFRVALTASGMAKAAAVVGDAPELRVYFDAFIDEDAIIGTGIPNQAHVSYENNVGLDFERDSDIPEVHTGGLALVKTDASNQARRLAGAVFTLNVKNEDGSFTPVPFYTDPAMTQQTEQAVTDANGSALFCGLAYGTYYLIETEAPEGYNLLSEPVELVINGTSHLEENAVTVTNSARFQLPETGGIGTALFTFGGAGILGAAALVLLGGRRKKN